MCRKSICLILFVLVVVTATGQADVTPVTSVVITRVENPGGAPNFWLESITVGGYTITVDKLVTGVSEGVATAQPAPYNTITNADNFDLNLFAGRSGEVPPTHQIKELGGESTWLNTNGDNPDFFVFETGGNQDFAIEAILPGGIIGQSVNVPQSTFGDTGLVITTSGPHNGQTIEGVAFAVTDLLDQNGNNLTNGSIIEGIQISSDGYDPSGFYAVASAEPGLASAPSPADGATDVPRDVVLSWTPGEFAPAINGHKVYLSESFNDVNDGIGAITQSATSYAPGQRLDFNTTYYWRIDEVNAPPDSTVYEGRVWSFTTEPLAYPVENVTVTASSQSDNQEPENSINGSGLDVNDLHSIEPTDMWLSGEEKEPNRAWIEYELDKVYKLHEMLVWNFNGMMESLIGIGFKDVTIEYSVNGTDYTTLGTTAEFARAPGTLDYAHNTNVDFNGVTAKYIRLTANSNWGSLLDQYGLSEVRFLYIPVRAREPNPDSGALDVSIGTIDEPIDVTLGFRAGREAVTHNVYLSTDWQAVADGTAPVTTVTETSYGPLSLDLGKIYYWRVDEVNEAETSTTWQSDIWNFRTQKYFVVDDFEDYNDYPPDEIWFTWVDGYGVPSNGATAGYPAPDFLAGEHYVETTIVRGGQQSMPYFYDNSGPANYSEATLTLSSPRDWTIKGIEALSLRFRGNPAGFVEGPAGTYTMNASGVDIWNEADEFRYAYKQLSGDGEITATVESVLWVSGSDDWTKAGVMIRDTLDAGSKNAFIALTTGSGDGATFQWRNSADGSSDSSRTLVGISPPFAIRLVRQGNTFTSYVFLDGQWQQEGQSATVAMTDPVYIGLALTSHSSGVTTEAVFSDVQTTGAVSGVFTQQAIGVDMPTNVPTQMYVAVASGGGTPVVVDHNDPNATQVSTWTEWSIDLTEFSNQGVVLTNIDSISIGFGDKANPQPGGTGVVYFDDIRLYPYRGPPEEIWLEAEAADSITSPMNVYDDPGASGGQYIGTEDDITGDEMDAAPADGVATYSFTVAGGIYKILGRVIIPDGDSFWVRIPGAINLTPGEDPDQPGTGWVRWSDPPDGDDWHWEEVFSGDHDGETANWTLPAGTYTLEIARREDGALLDTILITDDVD
jgi:hypothetical protein